jgi:hypothetical protein
MEVSGQLHALAALPHDNSAWYQLNKRLVGPQSPLDAVAKEKSYHCPRWELNLGRPARSPANNNLSREASGSVKRLKNIRCEI